MVSSAHPEKTELRRQVLQQRAAMAPAARREASLAIRRRLFDLPQFRQAGGVHCFVSLAEEVDTDPIFQKCWEMGKKTFLPFQRREQGVLGCARREPGQPLVPGPFGVLEPAPENRLPVALEQIDLVVVPGVAFDRAGWRLGYGKGYYDLFLQNLVNNGRKAPLAAGPGAGTVPTVPTVTTVALAFAGQVVPTIPREDWDVRIGVILTESETIIPA